MANADSKTEPPSIAYNLIAWSPFSIHGTVLFMVQSNTSFGISAYLIYTTGLKIQFQTVNQKRTDNTNVLNRKTKTRTILHKTQHRNV
jgi:hypothetical protein